MEARRRVKSAANNVCWKRLLEQTREVCDQCKTHVFNFHYACRKCGFTVCLSCYDDRKNYNKYIGIFLILLLTLSPKDFSRSCLEKDLLIPFFNHIKKPEPFDLSLLYYIIAI